MGLTFIIGKPGSGKTAFCIGETVKRQKDGGKPVFYIVPEQFSLQSEKAIVKASGGAGIYNINVTGFNRLAYTVFAETGAPEGVLLEDTGKSMLVRKILFELKNELAYYKSAFDKQGFVFEICEQITEFIKYSVPPEKLLAVKEGAVSPSREALRLKISDLYKIYSRYREYQKEKYISGDDTLDLLAERIKLSEKLQGADIFVDGYKGFTPQEYKVVKALMLKAGNIFVTLTADINVIRDEGGFESVFFDEVRRTRQRLIKLAEECGVTLMKDILLNEPVRYLKSAGIARVRDYFFKGRVKPYGGDCDYVRVYEAENKNDEIHNAARLIVSLCRERGYKYNEIAVMVNFLPDYDMSIKAIFPEYGIPVFIDSTDDILSHPLTEWIRSLVAVVATGWSYESVFRLLKTNLSPLGQTEIDMIENYALAYGIRGSKWKKPFKYGFAAAEDENGGSNANCRYDEGTMERLRLNVWAIGGAFEEKCGKGSHNVRYYCEALYGAVAENGIPEKLAGLTDRLNGLNEIEKADSCKRVWDIVIDVLDKMVEILGSEKVTLAEFAKILDSGLSSAVLGAAPPSLDQLVVGDLRRSRFADIKALIILGANEGMMPSVIKESGLLSGDEKDYLHRDKNIELAPTAVKRTYEERFLIYCALAKPSEFLAASYFKGGLDGKPYEPSFIIGRIREILPSVNVRLVSAENIGIDGVTVCKPVFSGLSGVMRSFLDEVNTGEEGIPAIFKDVYGYFIQNSEYSGKIRKWEEIIENSGRAEGLSGGITEKLYGRKIKASVSKLEKYVQCPFSYFLNYNLYAGERKIYELQSVDIGNIFHSALNRFAKKLKKDKREWKGIPGTELAGMADECINESLDEPGNEILKSSGQYSYFGERAREITKKSLWALNEHMNRGGFTLSYSEAVFADGHSDGLGAIRLPLESGEMTLEGKIDRIDMLDLNGNKYVKIMDYKTGDKKFLFAEAFYGLQLQLTLYMDAFIKKCAEEYGQEYADKIYPGAMLYFTLANPFIDISGVKSVASGEVEGDKINFDDIINKELLKKYKMSGIVLRDKDIIKNIDSEAGKSSDIIPVTMKVGKATGAFDDMEFSELSATSALPVESFLRLMDYAVRKASEIGNDILSGKIKIAPYLFNKSNGCRFCDYKPVCLFDVSRGGQYNRMKRIKEKDAMLEITGKEKDHDNDQDQCKEENP